MTTVSIFLPNLVQGTLAEASGYTMLLVKPSDKSLLNGAGDSLAWAGNGWLTAEVAEPWTETLSVTVVDGDGLVPFGGWLGVGSVVVADGVAELNTAGQEMIAAFNAMRDGNVFTAASMANADDLTLAAIASEAAKTAAIKTKTDQFAFTTANRVDASATVSIAAADIRSAIGMSAADLDNQLDAILAAASASAGSGARTVTVTVNDGLGNLLQNAVVRMTEGANSYRALTNASGVAVFNLDDATYVVAITKAGYSYSGTTIVVNGTETATYSMTRNSPATPSSGHIARRSIRVSVVDRIT